MTNLLQLLVALNPLNIAFHLCKKAINTVSFAKEGLQKCKLQLDNTLEVIVDILQQSPLGSQISGEFYELYSYLPPVEHTPEEPEHKESEHEDHLQNSLAHSLDLPLWCRYSPYCSTQEATMQSEASTSRSSSHRSRWQSTQFTPPRPTLQQRISSPTRLHHSGELDFSDIPFNHHCHSMEATFSCDEDGEVIYT
ncbi:hypothetical protein LXA43DRAFT_1102741 [Ganoderma leucocontextum]|nr:hypothetical protein LXA43DRAFT_1102741 [Ganoderma leucocontextum]